MKLNSLGMLVIPIFTLAIAANAGAAVIEVKDGESIQAGVNKSAKGDTIRVYPGTYRETVFIDKDNIHLLGVVKNGKWPVMDGEDKLNDGILASGHGVIIERMHVRRFKGNGIMTQGANNFKILRNRVEGRSFYGIFPQFGQNGLVAWNTIWNVEDAAIYAGMCRNVDIIANETHSSVMGIETENSHDMLVEGNYVHDNTIGLMLSLIQGLPIKTANNTIVRNNFIVENNHPNFALPGTITEGLPDGTGMFVFAADGAVIENNVFRDNHSVGIMLVDQTFLPGPPDPKEDPRPDNAKVLDNIFLNNATAPKGIIASMLEAAGRKTGADLISTGRGKGSCVLNRESISELGTENWAACATGTTSTTVVSMQTPRPVPSPELTKEQMGRLTYLAVCTGCHSVTTRIIGPPMMEARALYVGKPEAMARWIANPTRKRPNFPQMPPQNYLPEDVRLAVSRYILEQLEP